MRVWSVCPSRGTKLPLQSPAVWSQTSFFFSPVSHRLNKMWAAGQNLLTNDPSRLNRDAVWISGYKIIHLQRASNAQQIIGNCGEQHDIWLHTVKTAGWLQNNNTLGFLFSFSKVVPKNTDLSFTSSALAVTENSEGHISKGSRSRSAESVCDLGRHAVNSAQRERRPSGGRIREGF